MSNPTTGSLNRIVTESTASGRGSGATSTTSTVGERSSSSRMVPTAWPPTMVAPLAPTRFRKNVSSVSSWVSPRTGTLTVARVCPGAKVTTESTAS